MEEGGAPNPVASLFLICCFLFVIASCSSKNREKGYVYYRLSTNPSTLDPALVVDVPGGALSAKLFNGLVKTGEDLSVKPDIAEHWSISKDGLSYTFVLKKGVTFSNGREVKARDFKYSFERILDAKNRSPNTWVFERILGADDYMRGLAREVSGIAVIDDYTIKIRLKRQFSPFLSLLTVTAAYVVPREEVERWGPDFSSHPVGSGPFTLKEWLPGREIRLEKRRDYFDVPAKVSGMLYRIIPEDLTAVTEFESGNIDVLTIPVSEFSRYKNDPERKNFISRIEGLNTYYVGLNCSRPPFDNLNLRKAISFGVDREKILDTIYEKRGRKASGPLPDVLRAWAVRSSYEYNPRKARELVKKEGLDGVTVNFFITPEQEVIDIAEVIQSYVEDIGIKVKIRQLEWSAYKEAINKGEADMFYLSWWADYPDPENFLFPLFHSSNHGPGGNRTRYTNKAVDQLIEIAERTLEKRKRESFYKKAEEIIVADAPWVFLWHRTDFSVRQPWTKNYKDFPIYSMDKGVNIEIDDARTESLLKR